MQWCVCVLIVHGCGSYCLAAMWTSHAVVVAAVALAAALCSVCTAAATPIIFDTDIGTDFGEGRHPALGGDHAPPPLTVSCMACAMACSQHARPFWFFVALLCGAEWLHLWCWLPTADGISHEVLATKRSLTITHDALIEYRGESDWCGTGTNAFGGVCVTVTCGCEKTLPFTCRRLG